MDDETTYQQELRETIDLGQSIVEKHISSLSALWKVWMAGLIGNDESMLRMILELLLFASQNIPEGQILFINALESSKKDYPKLVAEIWEAFDNWDNIHKTDFFRID